MVKRQKKSDSQDDGSQVEQKYNADSRYNSQSSQQQKSFQKQQDMSDIEQQDSRQIQLNFDKLKKQQEKIKQQLKELPYGLILRQKMQLERQKNIIVMKKKLNTKGKMAGKNNGPQEVKDKNGPKEISIHKRHAKKIVTIFEPSRQKTIDPRFQEYAGSYNPDLAMKSFDFIPKIQQQQIKALRTTLDKSKKTANKRSRKKLSAQQRVKLQQQYNLLTSQKRQIQLQQIQKQVKRNIRQRDNSYNQVNTNHGQYQRYNRQLSYQKPRQQNRYNRQSSYQKQGQQQRYQRHRNSYIDKKVFKEQFQKVKMSKMTELDRKEYLKNKQKKIFRTQQVQRNNLMYQTSNAYRKSKN